MKKLLNARFLAQCITGLCVIAMGFQGTAPLMAQSNGLRPPEQSQPQRKPPPGNNDAAPTRPPTPNSGSPTLPDRPIDKPRPPDRPQPQPQETKPPLGSLPDRPIDKPTPPNVSPPSRTPRPPLGSLPDRPIDKPTPPDVSPPQQPPRPPRPPRDRRPPHVIVIDNPQTIVETQTVVQEVAAIPQLTYPRATVFIKYKNIARSTVVATILQPKGMQPVAMETQAFAPGPIVRWEANPVMPGRDVYEFWIGYGNGNLQKVDVVFYGDSITVWDDGDLVIIVG